jgi:serpin B
MDHADNHIRNMKTTSASTEDLRELIREHADSPGEFGQARDVNTTTSALPAARRCHWLRRPPPTWFRLALAHEQASTPPAIRLQPAHSKVNSPFAAKRTHSALAIPTALFYSLALTTALAASPTGPPTPAAANAAFAFKLLHQLAQDQPRANILISPFGASTVLQMACNGAGGQTKTEIQQVLGTGNLQPADLARANKQLTQSLNAPGTNVVLSIANAIWCRAGTRIKPDFLAANQQSFDATIAALDFNDPRSVQTMNAWVAQKTHGKINAIADGMIRPLTELFLANAVYFKGKWLEPFDPKTTRERPFHLSGSAQKKLPMMEQSRKFTYRRGTGYQAVRLEYQGCSLAMYLFLPDPDSSPQKFLSIMTGDKWQRVARPGFAERQGMVVLPKFRARYSVELNQPLIAMGMRAAFGKADFSGISDDPLFISAVRQRAFVEVNEEGTEAAAVTGLAMELSAPEPNPPKPFEMILDRPFLFLIEDSNSAAILFMGVIFDPPAA